MENRKIYQGDVLERLKDIPDNSVDCIITSPPYWALRDYGVEGQIGLESDFHDFLKIMKKLMDGLKTVLKPTGTCFIDIGDNYCIKETHGIVPKSRMGIPERFYVQSIDNGWIARNYLIWNKPNPMPQSTSDRFSNVWEAVFFFTKDPKYFFNLDAIREKAKTENKKAGKTPKEDTSLTQQTLGEVPTKEETGVIKEKYKDLPDSNVARLHRGRKGNPNYKQDNVIDPNTGKPKATYEGFNKRWIESLKHEHGSHMNYANERGFNPKGKNPGDVMNIAAHAFSGAHFATFPEELPMTLLKAGCPKEVCTKCNEPRFPITLSPEEYQKFNGETKWTECNCNEGFKPGFVLDPFFGAGTVGVVAEKYGVNWIGIELNPEYIEIAKERLKPLNNTRLFE